jgi:hypothetical protein
MMQDLCNEDYNAGLKAGKQIVVLAKDNYGKTMFYPVCDNSKVFAAIAGQITLSETNIRRIRQLGYEVTVTYPKTQTFDFTNP